MIRTIERHPVSFLLVVCAGLYFFNPGILQVTIMEARNFVVAREMISDSNWLLTTMNGIARYEKPPLPAWIITPFMELGGNNSIAACRLPTSIIATLGPLIMFLFVRDVSGNGKLALYSSLVLATSFYYVAIRFEAPSDTYTHVFMFAGIYFLFKFLRVRSVNSGFLLLAGLATGLSILSKGPVGPYALLLPFLAAYFFTFKSPLPAKKFPLLAVFILVAAVTGGSWFLYVRIADPEVFMEIVREETGNWSSYNIRPFYYYWSFFLQSGIWALPALMSLIYPYIRSRVNEKDLYKLSWIWVIAGLVLLSAIPEKKTRYIVPLLIPLAVTTAIYLNYLFNNFQNLKKTCEKITPRISFGLIGLTGLSFPVLIFFLNIETSRDMFWYLTGCVSFVATGLFILQNTISGRFKNAFYLTVLISVLAAGIGVKTVEMMQQNDNYRPFNQFVNREELPLYHYYEIDPETVWEAGEPSLLFDIDSLSSSLPGRFYIIAKTGKVDELKEILQEKNLSVEKEEIFDRNYFSPPGSKYYNERHKIHLILVES